MIISHKYKFIFVKTAKTAGTSVEVFLSKYCDDRDVVTPIIPPEQSHQPRNFSGYFNPIPEILSHKPHQAFRTFTNLLRKKIFYNHISASLIKSRIPKSIWDNYFKFCIERNPWDKTLSHYYFVKSKKSNLSFDEYMQKRKFPFNYPYYTDGMSHKKIIVDEVVKYENLFEGLKGICDNLGIPFRSFLDVKAKTSHRLDRRPYQEVFSNKHRSVVEESFRREIEMHGYKFD